LAQKIIPSVQHSHRKSVAAKDFQKSPKKRADALPQAFLVQNSRRFYTRAFQWLPCALWHGQQKILRKLVFEICTFWKFWTSQSTNIEFFVREIQRYAQNLKIYQMSNEDDFDFIDIFNFLANCLTGSQILSITLQFFSISFKYLILLGQVDLLNASTRHDLSRSFFVKAFAFKSEHSTLRKNVCLLNRKRNVCRNFICQIANWPHFTHGKTIFTSHVSPLRYLCTAPLPTFKIITFLIQNVSWTVCRNHDDQFSTPTNVSTNTFVIKHRTLISVDFLITLTVSFIQFKHFLNFLLIILIRNATVFAFKMKLLCHHDLQTSKRMSN
jgi:hypothetical protein